MKTKAKTEKTALFNARLPLSLVEEIRSKAGEARMTQTEMATLAFRRFLADPGLKKIAKLQDEMARSFSYAHDQQREPIAA